MLFLWLFFDIYFEWCLYLICRTSISTIRNRPSNEKCKKIMCLYQIPSIQTRYCSDLNRPSNEKMKKSWIFIECFLYELFSNFLCDLQISVSTLKSRVCSLFVSSLAMKNSANVENRKETNWYAITQRRRYVIESIFRWFIVAF